MAAWTPDAQCGVVQQHREAGAADCAEPEDRGLLTQVFRATMRLTPSRAASGIRSKSQMHSNTFMGCLQRDVAVAEWQAQHSTAHIVTVHKAPWRRGMTASSARQTAWRPHLPTLGCATLMLLPRHSLRNSAPSCFMK